MMLCMKRGRKIIGLGRSKDLDLLMSYKGKVQKNHGLSRSKDLDFNRFIYEIGKKMMGLSRSKDLPKTKKQKNLCPLSESLKRFTTKCRQTGNFMTNRGNYFTTRVKSAE